MSSEDSRNSSIARPYKLLADLLKGREHDRHSVAKLLGVKPAMANRHIKAALEYLPLSSRTEGRKRLIRWTASSAMSAPSYATAVAACFGASVWPLFRGSTYEVGIRNALAQVTGRTRRSSTFKHIDRKFWFLSKGGEPALIERSALLDELLEAVLHHRIVAVRYIHFDGEKEVIRVEPLSIVVHDHQLYLVARRPDRLLHPYRFCRMDAVDVLEEPFVYPNRNEYDPEQVFRDSFGVFLNLPAEDVEIRVDKRWATYAQTHRWHGSQNVTVDADDVRIRLHVRICPELEAWILGFGEHAEVVSPRSLRERITARIRTASQRLDESPAMRQQPNPRSAKRRARRPRRARALS
jgi:predicted DNA-binding transcriptional regulator YafY